MPIPRRTPPVRRRAVPLMAAALALLCACARHPHPVPAPAAFDPHAVEAVLDAQRAAWNRGDLDAFMDGYWRSDSLTFYSGGDVRRYRSEGRAMGTLRFDLHSIDALGEDAALVRGAWHLTLGTSEPHGLFSLLLRRIPGQGWKIVHDHTSVAP